jgi:hypothetical protein
MGGSCSKPKNDEIHFDFGDGHEWKSPEEIINKDLNLHHSDHDRTSREESESTGAADLAPRAVSPSRSPYPENKAPLWKAPAPKVNKSGSKRSVSFQPPVSSTTFKPRQAAAVAAAAVKAAPPASAPARPPTQLLDDDDFSVAPSLDLECRSIGKTKFDDIYTRGREVSPKKKKGRCS